MRCMKHNLQKLMRLFREGMRFAAPFIEYYRDEKCTSEYKEDMRSLLDAVAALRDLVFTNEESERFCRRVLWKLMDIEKEVEAMEEVPREEGAVSIAKAIVKEMGQGVYLCLNFHC